MSPSDPVSFARKPTLMGKQVTLRPPTAADAPGLVELIKDPEVRRLTGTHGAVRPGALGRAEELYAKVASETDSLWLVIVERETGAYVGEVVLNELDVENRSCKFRIALVGPRAFGRGYGTEASRLMLGHAFEVAGVNRIELEVHAFNPRARRVYEKVGFVHEGTKRQELLWNGEWVDTEIMAVLAEDWARHGGHPLKGI